jgi:hypothetical protein
MIGEIFEYIVEFFSGLGEMISGLFEGLGELNMAGLIVGLVSVIFIFATRSYMLNAFLKHMTPLSALFWGGATYVTCFIVGYMIGSKILAD